MVPSSENAYQSFTFICRVIILFVQSSDEGNQRSPQRFVGNSQYMKPSDCSANSTIGGNSRSIMNTADASSSRAVQKTELIVSLENPLPTGSYWKFTFKPPDRRKFTRGNALVVRGPQVARRGLIGLPRSRFPRFRYQRCDTWRSRSTRRYDRLVRYHDTRRCGSRQRYI